MFGGGLGSTGFNFGSAVTSSSGGFSFGATKSTTAITTTSSDASNLFSSASVSSASTIGPLISQKTAVATTTTAAAPAFTGLGGVDAAKKDACSNDSNGKNDVISTAVQDQAVPDEICKDVKVFENYVAKQKEESSEVGKFSVRSLHKISEEVKSLSASISTISSAVNRNKAYVEKLREAFSKQLKHAEMAQRTQNIPPTLQPDNIAPVHYFVGLANSFDENMKLYRQQIDELENHLQSAQTYSLTPQDISFALVKMQETFVTLASNLHSIHDNVKHLKEQYLAYRRVVHNDNVDVFAIQKENKLKSSTADRDKDSCRCHLGMPAFQNLSNVAALAVASMMQPQQPQAAPPQQTFLNPSFGATGFGTGTTNGFGAKRTVGGLFGGTSTTTSSAGGLFGGTGFGKSTISKTTASSAGVKSTSSGNIFFGNTSFNSSAGVTFGGAAAANKNTFDLKPPPAGNKRNKKII